MSKYMEYTKKVKELMPDLDAAEHTAHEIYGNKCGDNFHIFSAFVSANKEKGIEISLGIVNPSNTSKLCWHIVGEILLEEYTTNRIYRIRDPQKEHPHMTYGSIDSNGRCSSIGFDPDYQYIDQANSVKELLEKMEKYRKNFLSSDTYKDILKEKLAMENRKIEAYIDELP